MPPYTPTKTSKEIHVEIHPVSGERLSKSSRRGHDKDEKKVVIDSPQHDEDMASAQISALQKSMQKSILFPNGRVKPLRGMCARRSPRVT